MANLNLYCLTWNHVHCWPVVVTTGSTTTGVTGTTSTTTGNLQNFNLAQAGWYNPATFAGDVTARECRHRFSLTSVRASDDLYVFTVGRISFEVVNLQVAVCICRRLLIFNLRAEFIEVEVSTQCAITEICTIVHIT